MKYERKNQKKKKTILVSLCVCVQDSNKVVLSFPPLNGLEEFRKCLKYLKFVGTVNMSNVQIVAIPYAFSFGIHI